MLVGPATAKPATPEQAVPAACALSTGGTAAHAIMDPSTSRILPLIHISFER
jgi:hypothetical protein